MSEYAIQTENIVKYFDGRCVLDGVDLRIPQGGIYGLLGRNGAGKTTIIRILLGLEPATRGEANVLGASSWQLPASVLGQIGYVAEGHNLIPNYSVRRIVELYKRLSARWNEQFFRRLLETFRLPMERKASQLSRGMRAQLNLSLAMATEPKLLILDDPTLGLDTVARRQFLELAIELISQNGRTILFCSHILSDVERLADRIGILRAGKLVVDCELDELKKRVRKLRLIFDGQPPMEFPIMDIIAQRRQGREMTITVANWNENKQAILNIFKPASCTEIPMTLEEIFIECTASGTDAAVDYEQGEPICSR
ncbi:MAG: ABC transporter ATP-binding protein [Sedimentisphaerales bacterium]|jgi:ABC-2 type transport system ATP-binding protein